MTQAIVTVRAGERLPGAFVRLLATEDMPSGMGTNTQRAYTVVVLLNDSADEEETA